MLLPVAEIGHPVLWQKASQIEKTHDIHLQHFIDNMLETMLAARGYGIAAPQVQASIQLFIIKTDKRPEHPEIEEVGPLVIINPEIIGQSEETTVDWEGCLSIPGLRAKIERSQAVIAKFRDRDGQERQMTFKNYLARIFLHEYDHIQGKLFFDRLNDRQALYSEQEYTKINQLDAIESVVH